MRVKDLTTSVVTAHDKEWMVAARSRSLLALAPEMRRLAAAGLEQGKHYLPFKRGPRQWWLLRELKQ